MRRCGILPHSLRPHLPITQCATDGFGSFLWRWISLIEVYNMVDFSIYHIARCVRVLEEFDCILLGG